MIGSKYAGYLTWDKRLGDEGVIIAATIIVRIGHSIVDSDDVVTPWRFLTGKVVRGAVGCDIRHGVHPDVCSATIFVQQNSIGYRKDQSKPGINPNLSRLS